MWVRVYLGVFHHSGRKILAALFREVFLFLVPFLLFLGLAASVATGHGTPMLWTVFALSAAVVAGQHAMGVVSYRLADADLRYLALALPAGFILAGILFHAWVTLVFNRSVEWKGRRVRPGGGAPPSP
jgi:hypothetical protein